jgi:hypothetical protein
LGYMLGDFLTNSSGHPALGQSGHESSKTRKTSDPPNVVFSKTSTAMNGKIRKVLNSPLRGGLA